MSSPSTPELHSAAAAAAAAAAEYLSFPRGGPIFDPDLVGPLTSVADFESAVLGELQGLEAELASSVGNFDDELSVNELKVFTEEELVEKALNDEFEDIPGIVDPVDIPGIVDSVPASEHAEEKIASHSVKESVCSDISAVGKYNTRSSASLNNAQTSTHDIKASEGATSQKQTKKRGRVFDRNCRAAELEGSYFAKVKQLADIKQKQDDDKASVRLHSFSCDSIPVESAITTSKKFERTKSLRFVASDAKVKPMSSQEHVPLCYPEVVLCVEIYHNQKISLKTQEFLVLGSQSLSGLKDNIQCSTDKLMQAAGEHDPSGYFLIEDTFVNDLRDPSSIDYSKPIFDWLKNCKKEAVEKWEYITSGHLKIKQKELLGNMQISNLPNFKAMNMHRTRFADLKFRLGAKYLYCHQGDCKHSIVIRDMRMIHPEDVQSRAEYPLLTFKPRIRHRKCSVCHIYLATKMTVDDKWAPVNPCYFCVNCYFLLHYKEDNSLLYPHVVFDYFHE